MRILALLHQHRAGAPPLHCAGPTDARQAMKVLVLGGGVIGASALRTGAAPGTRSTLVDRQPAPALETSFANAGEVSPGYSAPWAGPGRAAEGGQVAADAPQPAGDPAHARPGDVGWVAGDAAQLHRGALRAQQEPHGAAGRIQPRLHEALRADTGIAYDERMQGTLQLFRTQKQLDGIGGDIAVLEYGVPYEVLDRAGCIALEPALAARARQVRRRPAPARRRDRRLLQVHAAPGRDGRRRGVALPL